MANLSNINNILRVSSSGVGLNKNNTGPSELDIESAGADMIDMTRTGQKTYRFAISSTSNFSIFDVAANDDRLVISSAGDATFAGEVSLKSILNLQRSSAGATTLIQFKNENGVDRAHIDFGGTNEELSFFAGAGGTANMTIDSSGLVNIPAYADGNKLTITSSTGSGHNIIEMGQFGADGFLDVSAAGGAVVTHLSGYTGYASYFLSNVGIGTNIPGAKLSIGSGVAKTSTSTSEVLYLGQSNEASNYSTLQVYTKGGASQADRSVVFQTIEAGVANAGNIVLQPSGGNVGIGVTSPGAKLEINDGSTQTELRISVTGDTGYSTINFADASDINPGQIYYHHQQNLMNFRTNDVDRMRIAGTLITFPTVTELRGDIGSNKFAIGNMGDASSQMMVSSRGFLTFNVSNTGSALDATERMRIESSGRIRINGVNYDPTSAGGTDTGGFFLTGDTLGTGNFTAGIGFAMGTGTATISGYQNGTDSDRIGLCFFTHGSGLGSAAANESMRIKSGGEVLIGEFAANNNIDPSLNGFGFQANGLGTASCNFSNTNEMFVFNQRDGSGTTQIDFRNGNVERGKIQWTTSGTTYNTTSDYRLKENVVEMTGALDRVSQLKPSRFNFIADADTTVDGFLAHEVQDIVPQAVTGIKDEIRDNGTPKYQGIDQSKLVPLLVGAIQELKADNDSLRTRIETLENN